MSVFPKFMLIEKTLKIITIINSSKISSILCLRYVMVASSFKYIYIYIFLYDLHCHIGKISKINFEP